MIDADFIYYDSAAEKTVIIGSSGRHGFFCGTPKKWLNSLCLAHGSTYQGRIDAFRELTGTSQKPAVMISEMTNQMFFPTVSPDRSDCTWLCWQSVYTIRGAEMNHSLVIFFDGNKIELAIGIRTLKKQMQRCEEYLQKMADALDELQKNKDCLEKELCH